jgi:glycylpeptide N-tetradecanoyltransferase
LLEGFEWSDIDIMNDKDISEIYEFLRDNYVEDEDGYFRFDYAKEFLRWALSPPDYHKELIFAVRWSKNKRIMGFISGIIVNVRAGDKSFKCTEVNFLCV